jgi:aspartate 1-decarboxylase
MQKNIFPPLPLFYLLYNISRGNIMLLEFLYSKIHRATVTDANLNYVGSITIDETLLNAANMKEWQKVEILDVNNGERFQTYIIKGEPNSGCICLNGAAARKVQPGDKVIIVTYAQMEEKEAQNHKPTVVIVDDNNKIIDKK